MWESTEMHKNLVEKPEVRNLLENHDVTMITLLLILQNHDVRFRNRLTSEHRLL
jgi:uncharacterized protein YjgD (DUF1641 family)